MGSNLTTDNFLLTLVEYPSFVIFFVVIDFLALFCRPFSELFGSLKDRKSRALLCDIFKVRQFFFLYHSPFFVSFRRLPGKTHSGAVQLQSSTRYCSILAYHVIQFPYGAAECMGQQAY